MVKTNTICVSIRTCPVLRGGEGEGKGKGKKKITPYHPLVLRVLVAVVITWLPWYFIFFDNQDFPVYMTQSAKIYMAFLVNLPLFSLSQICRTL